MQVRAGDPLVQRAGRLDGAVGVVGQHGRHLEGDEAVGPAAAVVDRPQDARRPSVTSSITSSQKASSTEPLVDQAAGTGRRSRRIRRWPSGRWSGST